MFIEPKLADVKISKLLGANSIELHTGNFCNLFNKKRNIKKVFNKLKRSADYARNLGLEVHAGHGLTYKSAYEIAKIKNISEFNIGHFIISESIFLGLSNTIKKFRKIINS